MYDQACSTWVRLSWVDNGGILRGQARHGDLLGDLIKTGLPLVTGVQGVPGHVDAPVEASGLGPVGQTWLRGDESTARLLPWWPSCTAMFGDLLDGDGMPWAMCPRWALRRQVEALAERGFTMQFAFEPEFMLLGQSHEGGYEPISDSRFSSVHGLNRAHLILEELADMLELQGVAVEAMLKESAPGQYEMPLMHADPLTAAEHHLIFRETLAVVAAGHGLVSTMLPKVVPDAAGNGAHMHISLWRDGRDIMGDDDGESLSQEGRCFMAGVLDHLPALCALTAPTAASFHRIGAGRWSGNWCCWGWDNREAPLRVPGRRRGMSPTNIEFKTCDSTCNPYLAVAGVIAAGLDGLDRSLEPPDPVQVDPALLEIKPPPLPSDPGEACDALEHDDVLAAALGIPLLHACLGVRRAEWETMREWSLDHLVAELAELY